MRIKVNANTGFYIWLIYFLMVLLLGLLFGCNPVKRVINNPKYYDSVRDIVISNGECVNDSVYISDTTIILDTLHVIESTTDTLKIDSVIYITKTNYKTITKTVTIRDTTIVTDRSKEKLLQKEISKLLDEQIKLKQQIVNIEAEKKEIKKDRNKWRLYFFLLLGGIGLAAGLLIGWKVKTGALSKLLKF